MSSKLWLYMIECSDGAKYHGSRVKSDDSWIILENAFRYSGDPTYKSVKIPKSRVKVIIEYGKVQSWSSDDNYQS